MITQETALWDLAVLQCNKRKAGQAPVVSVAGQSEAEGDAAGRKGEEVHSNTNKNSQAGQTSLCFQEKTYTVSCDGLTMNIFLFYCHELSFGHVRYKNARKPEALTSSYQFRGLVQVQVL